MPDYAKPGSFEFYTSVVPNPENRTPKGYAWWKAGTPGVRSFEVGNTDWAAIPIVITKIK
ncbi:hypothetical protein SAMN05216223_116108 [Actinacidiphila yanglinensis]|uniref:Uncharacterized protein n=1 Tax=Actinacidiphila yanglinensis TaxID=310779 RepID=A0A1H6DJP4_9ACTN|nr:hypothetical protein SAMN05216223_116108 [Actinacidiphila yanglinensis]